MVLAFVVPWLSSIVTSAAMCCCSVATREILKSSARVAYSLLFMFSMLFAWMLRDFAKPVLSHIPWIIRQFGKDGEQPPDEWFGEQAVFRLSLGNFMLFSGAAIVMAFPAPVRFKDDWRDVYIHHGGYLVKALLWLVCNIVPFFFSNGVVTVYAAISKVVSPLFLAIQTLIIIDATHTWNDAWVSEGDEDDRYLYALLIATVGSYAGTLTIIILSYVWFSPSDSTIDCSFNMSLVTIGLIACMVLSLLTLHPKVRDANPGASVFVSSSISLYVAYLGFSALQSEPRDYECNMLGQRLNAASGTTLAMGMVLTLASTIWAAFRAGSNTHTFSTEEELLLDEVETTVDTEMTSAGADSLSPPGGDFSMSRGASDHNIKNADRDLVTYNYVQFYMMFALASMYTGMLMTGWGSGTIQKDMIDVGWTSVYVKAAAQWMAAGLYIWTLIAPVILPDRVF
jgi:hypothetical protein